MILIKIIELKMSKHSWENGRLNIANSENKCMYFLQNGGVLKF